MSLRCFCLSTVLAAALLAGAGPAVAQTVNPEGRGEWVKPPADLSKRAQRHGDTFDLDTLFAALKIAPDESSAKAIENRIWMAMLASTSDTANLLMGRVRIAIAGEDLDLGISLLDAVVAIKPDYIQAWNERATLHFMKKDYGRALADIAQVLAREPRHFGALAGLGLIMQEFGEDRLALKAYRQVMAIHPHMAKIADVVKTLTDKVEGRDI